MPVRINCPSCQASLSMPESMYGKAVRCPKCQSPFQCPTPSANAAPAPSRRAPAPAASGGNPFAFEEAAAPAGGDEADYEDDRPRRGGRRGGSGAWGAVNSGFLYLFLSTLCFFLCFSMLVLLPLLLKKDNPREPPSKTAQRIQDGTFVVLLMGGLVLAILGQVRCCAVPGVSGAKSTITVATVFMILATMAGLLVSFLTMRMAFAEPKTLEEFESLRSMHKLAVLSRIILATTLLASFILSVFFILLTAQHLQDKTLVGSTIAYAVVVVTSPLLVYGLLLFYVAVAERELRASSVDGKPATAGFFQYLPFLVLLVAAGWFAFLLFSLKGDVSRTARRSA